MLEPVPRRSARLPGRTSCRCPIASARTGARRAAHGPLWHDSSHPTAAHGTVPRIGKPAASRAAGGVALKSRCATQNAASGDFAAPRPPANPGASSSAKSSTAPPPPRTSSPRGAARGALASAESLPRPRAGPPRPLNTDRRRVSTPAHTHHPCAPKAVIGTPQADNVVGHVQLTAAAAFIPASPQTQ